MPGFFTWRPRGKRAASVEPASPKGGGAGSFDPVSLSSNGHHDFHEVNGKRPNGACLSHPKSMGQKIADRVELLSRLNQVWEDQHRSSNRKRFELATESAPIERPHAKVRFRELPFDDDDDDNNKAVGE